MRFLTLSMILLIAPVAAAALVLARSTTPQ